MIVWWLGGLAALAVVVWAFTRGGRASSPVVAERSSQKPTAARSVAPPKTAAARAPRKPKPAPKPPSDRKLPVLPSLADEGDDVEITMVKASPPGVAAREGKSDDGAKASTVAVTYEDDADLEEVTAPIARILVHAVGQSDQGRVRRRNEDSLLVFPERSVFVVADGMGGHKGGNVASALAVDTLKSAFERSVFDGKTESMTPVPQRALELACAIQMANHAILTRAKADRSLADMGTTVVATRFSPNKQRVYIAHVGDSRCYRIRGTTMRQLTSDHTMSELGVVGPGAGDLYQAVGVGPHIIIDVVVDKPRADDLYLLCSDGLSKMATDEEIRQLVVDEADLESAVYGLIQLANDRGGKDNVTVILIKILDRAPQMIMKKS